MDACQYTFVKPIECTTLTVKPNVNNGLWVIMTCQHSFSNFKMASAILTNVTFWSRILLVREALCVGTESIWELYFLLSFAVNFKTKSIYNLKTKPY